jgi:hypothetical protein
MAFLRRILGRQDQNRHQETPEGRESKRRTPDALAKLKREAAPFARAEYPFLSRDYAPGSRYPAMDFSEFVIGRLKADDWPSIYGLMEGIIEANPGLAVGADMPTAWIRDAAREGASVPFRRYVQTSDEDAYSELQALWVIASKSGSDRRFWLANSYNHAARFAKTMSCYEIEWLPTMCELVEAANTFIRSMRAWRDDVRTEEEHWFWDEQPLFTNDSWGVAPMSQRGASRLMKGLSLNSRVHMLDVVGRGGGPLSHVASSEALQFGLARSHSSKAIEASGLVSKPTDNVLLLKELSKINLLAECAAVSVDCPKSWTKSKLLAALEATSPERVQQLIDERGIVVANPRYAEDLKAILAYAKQLERPFQLLGFA